MAFSVELQREVPNLSEEVIKRAKTLRRWQLSSSIIAQARHYIEDTGLDPDKETLLLNGYGILREENIHLVNTMGDQELFAFVLKLYGREAEFDRFTRQFPTIFEVKQG